MDDIRTVETENTFWQFNLTRREYLRTPVGPERRHPATPYNSEWEPFLTLSRAPEDRFLVIRPVPAGEGRYRLSGPVVKSELTENDYDPPEEDALKYVTL